MASESSQKNVTQVEQRVTAAFNLLNKGISRTQACRNVGLQLKTLKK
jgi:hypothetical protein